MINLLIGNRIIDFSGHETFPCRYAWLPKAFRAIQEDSKIFGDVERSMVTMGVGKNMVRSIQFWIQAAGIAEFGKGATYIITDLGNGLLTDNGFDPFLEDIRTLWLIHWNLSTHISEPLFAWDVLLNQWQYREIARSEIIRYFVKEAQRLEKNLSSVTLENHFDTFLHTYVPTKSLKGEIREDNLDCPLVELELIQKVGERRIDDSGKREILYGFRSEEKPEITPELFVYCLNDYWIKRRPNEKTLSFRDVSIAHGSPGQIFKIPEWNIRERLETIGTDSKGVFTYSETATLQQIIRNKSDGTDFLAAIYDMETEYA